jgi:hypothetical protein
VLCQYGFFSRWSASGHLLRELIAPRLPETFGQNTTSCSETMAYEQMTWLVRDWNSSLRKVALPGSE